MLPDSDLIIVTGKGGVGRSTVAASIARSLARSGKKVLAIAMGGGDGLAAHLGLVTLGPDAQPGADGVAASVVEPRNALDEYLRLYVKPSPLRIAGRLFRVLAQAVPGLRDVVVIGKCIHESKLSSWDAVVVDGAPTGQIESLLSAPSVIESLAPRGPVHDQAASLRRTLEDPAATRLVVVATPEELALTEAAELSASTRRGTYGEAPTLVVNKALSTPGFEAAPAGRGPLTEAARLHLDLLAAQTHRLAATKPDLTLPFVFGAASPQDVTAALTESIGE